LSAILIITLVYRLLAFKTAQVRWCDVFAYRVTSVGERYWALCGSIDNEATPNMAVVLFPVNRTPCDVL